MATGLTYAFDPSKGETPSSLMRKRRMAEALMGSVASAPRNVGEGLNAIGQALLYRSMMGKAEAGEKAGLASGQKSMGGVIDALGLGKFPSRPSANGNVPPPDGSVPLPEADVASARVSQAHGDNDIRGGIIQTASALGVDPVDLGTAISYETAGTFDPTKRGPTTQWGQHRGLIQFGEPQAKKYGVDWNDPLGSQLGPEGAVANYLRDTGVEPGMGLMDIYSAINAGGVGRYDRSDANNGGAPGTVADKVNNQMSGHRKKAMALLGMNPSASAQAPAPAGGLTPDALQEWAASNYQPSQANDAVAAVNALGAERPAPMSGPDAGMAASMAGQGQQPLQPRPGTMPRLQQAMPPQQADAGATMLPTITVPPGPQAPGAQPRLPAQAGPAMPQGAPNQPAANAPRLAMSGNVDIPQPTGPTMQQLAEALGNPWLPEEFRPIAQGLLEQQMQAQDPRYQLDLDYRRAQIAKLQGEATGAGQAELGLNPQYGVDAQGNPVLIQIGKDGRAVQTAMPDGVSLSKEPIKMDAGTHFVLLDPITRQPVGQVPKDNYQEAFDKGAGGAAGKAQAEAAANLPTDLATAEQAITELDQLINHPGLPDIAGSFDQYRPSWTMGAEGKDALARFNQAKGRAFLQAFGMLKGGGQITEVEGLKAEQAMARMDRAQGETEFKQALIDFRDAVKTGMDKMRQRAGGAVPTADYGPEGNGNISAPSGQGEPSGDIEDLLKKYGG